MRALCLRVVGAMHVAVHMVMAVRMIMRMLFARQRHYQMPVQNALGAQQRVCNRSNDI